VILARPTWCRTRSLQSDVHLLTTPTATLTGICPTRAMHRTRATSRCSKGPGRVVGRLPDLARAKEPSYLIALLMWQRSTPRPRHRYRPTSGCRRRPGGSPPRSVCFNVFGNSSALTLAPPNGPTHPAARLAPWPISSTATAGRPTPPSTARTGRRCRRRSQQDIARQDQARHGGAVECCYGAELYDSVTLALRCRSASTTWPRVPRLFRQHYHRLRAGRGNGAGRPDHPVFPAGQYSTVHRSVEQR